jgi:hypothetical protein
MINDVLVELDKLATLRFSPGLYVCSQIQNLSEKIKYSLDLKSCNLVDLPGTIIEEKPKTPLDLQIESAKEKPSKIRGKLENDIVFHETKENIYIPSVTTKIKKEKKK